MSPKSHGGEFTEDQLRQFDAKWKSWFEGELGRLSGIMADMKVDQEKYNRFLDLLIEREADQKELRKAILRHTLSGLIWAALAGLFALAITGTKGELVQLINAVRGSK